MKKILLTIFLFFILILKANAITYGSVSCFENTTPLTVRDSAGGTKIGSINCNSKVEITSLNGGSSSTCNTWYQIKYNNELGYVCSNYIYDVKEESGDTNTDITVITTPVDRSLNGSLANVLCVENTGALSVRSSVGGSTVASLSCTDTFTITNDNAGTTSSCNTWYQIKYNDSKIGYVCGKYVGAVLINTLSVAETEAYKTKLKEAGFPDSYLNYLVLLHAKYPNWKFEASKTNLDFNTIISNELGGNSLIYYTYGEDYRSKEEESYNYLTDSYNRHPTEKSWWYASKEAIAYFLDPRVYLNENYIFVFENLAYNPLFHTKTSIVNLFANTFLASQDANFADYIMGASSKHGVSPIHLSTRILQEQGTNGSISSSGKEFTYKVLTGYDSNDNAIYKNYTYSGYYNLFNIGAYSSQTYNSPAIMGLIKAMGGINKTDTSYGKPWDSIEKSIYGGAQFLSEGYISKGQGTLYYQKWDISPISKTRYTHQYMANIVAPVTETLKTRETYKNIVGLFDQQLTFTIPVFNSLPENISMHPANTNPNNYLKELKINDKSIDNFNTEKYEYNYSLNSSIKDINISSTTISSKASVSITNTDNTIFNNNSTIDLTDAKTEKISINVKAENGNIKTYVININKIEDGIIIKPINEILNNVSIKFNDKYISGINIGTDINSLTNNINKYATNNSTNITVNYKDKVNTSKTSGSFKTGDVITINNGEKDYSYQVVIYGDIDSDGEITILDLLTMKKIILNSISTNNLEKTAADVDKDNNVTILDLLEMKKDILNSKKITQ